jgi:hypothetical protein
VYRACVVFASGVKERVSKVSIGFRLAAPSALATMGPRAKANVAMRAERREGRFREISDIEELF